MKHIKRHSTIYAIAVLLCIPVLMAGTPVANAQGLIIASPGYQEQFPFYVDSLFDIQQLGPATTFLIVALGSGEEVPAGTLTLTLTPNAKSSDFLFKLNFMIFGTSYALDGTPALISASKASPLKIVEKIPINSSFGIAAIAVLVTSVDNPGDFTFPAPFTLLVELSAGEPAS